jgi:TonB-linked SusC/RagA family outer membrane protein
MITRKLIGLLVAFAILPTLLVAQTERISINMTDVTLNDVLNEIEKQTSFSFLVNEKIIDVTRKVDAVYKDVSITEILDNLFKDGTIQYVISNRQIILTPKKDNPQQEKVKPIKVSGRITDIGTNEPLPGVNIRIQGTSVGAITDFEGNYSLEVPDANTSLIFSFIGYKTQTIALVGKSEVDIKMEVDTKGLDEVVVTALGIKREVKAIGYSVQAVEGEGLQTVKTVDVGTSLTGKVAGLNVLNSTEFAEEPTVLIRGEEPILVIDGVPYANMTLRDIPSDDIESLSILKGATASALYGYRGQTGAIMITTKKGSEKKGLTVSFNSSNMFAAGFLAIPEAQSVYGREVELINGELSAVTNGDGSWGPPLEGQMVIQWDPIEKVRKSMPYLPVGKDNFKNFLEPGYILNNNINISHQSEIGSFRVSATSVQNKGQYPNSMFNKFTYSMSGDIKADNFTLASSMSYNKHTSPNIGFNGYTGYDPMYSLLIWSAPDFNVLDLQDYWITPNVSQNNSFSDTNNNPYFDRNERTHSLDKDILNASITLSYSFAPWLKATIRSGYDTYSNRQVITVPMSSLISAGSATVVNNGNQVWGESTLGSYNIGLGRGYSFNNDFLLTGIHELGKFSIDGLLGGSIAYNQDEGTDSRTQGGIKVPGFYSLAGSVENPIVESNIYRKQVNSLFGRLVLSWNKLIYVDATYRNDWSSTLSKKNRMYTYPSLSGSFIASELLPEIDWLSLWKLRASWTVARDIPSIYEINSVYNITQNGWGTLSSATLPTTIRNDDVYAEGSATWELGTAVNIYKNRASVDIAYYQKRKYDGLEYAEISSASGYYNNYINSDTEYTKKGWEVTLNTTPYKTKELTWDVAFNWTTYATYYTALDELIEDHPWIDEGKRTDAYVTYDYQYDPSGNIIHRNGVPLYSLYPSNIGYSDPDWIWGITNRVSYKNWDASISIDGRVGGLTKTVTEMYMWRSGSHPKSVVPERYLDATVSGSRNYIGQGVMVESGSATYDVYGNIITDDRVFVPNDVATTYQNYINTLHSGTAWGGNPSTVDVYDATFFKIRELAITYKLPTTICSKMMMQSASVSAIGQNLFLWAKQFKYSDPDGGYENFSDPSIRYVGLNLKVVF